MNGSVRRIVGAVAGVAAVATLAGCGGGNNFAEQPAADIQKAAVADMKALDSVTMEGKLTQGDTELGLELSLNTDGDCTGSLTQGDGTAQLVSTGGKSYLKGDEAFWTGTAGGADQGKAILAVLGDKWALFPQSTGGFAEICDLDQLLSSLGDGKSKLTKGDVSDVDGEEVVAVTSKADDGDTVAKVATGDKHYILEISKDGGTDSGSFSFSKFDEPVDVQAPAEDQVVDLTQAGG